ncbi:MmgE/PrpD family protein [Variovorax defluvii]|uniref:MmgE/PrpD family protein n=1 Tax=Variovorax defluvii TaxID=913761 RepID=A0ABP8I1D4_9BURK
MRITEGIAERVAATRIENLPKEAVDYSATLAMSALGAMVSGHRCTGGAEAIRYVRRQGGEPQATVLGAGLRTSVELAGFANGTFAHATEYEDDSFPEAVSSYTLFPPIFALAEHLHSPGSRVIEAFVAGYEAQARIGLACREARRIGYMVLSLAGSIGVAVAAAKLLGLDAKQTADAISIAASQGGGIGYQTGTAAHIVEMGFSARNGIAAAFMAKEGMNGQSDVLEAPRGLMNMITGGKVQAPEKILSEWGKPYRIFEVGIKSYPCCYHLQRMIESAQDLTRERRLGADDIAKVEVEVNAFFPTVVQHPEPRNEIEAQFSLPHAVALGVLEAHIGPASFSRERIEDERFRRFRPKVKTIVREEWGWTPTGWDPRITYTLASGEVIVREPKTAKGQPPALYSFDECAPKYHGCVDDLLTPDRVASSIEMLRHLATLPDAAALVAEVAAITPYKQS